MACVKGTLIPYTLKISNKIVHFVLSKENGAKLQQSPKTHFPNFVVIDPGPGFPAFPSPINFQIFTVVLFCGHNQMVTDARQLI